MIMTMGGSEGGREEGSEGGRPEGGLGREKLYYLDGNQVDVTEGTAHHIEHNGGECHPHFYVIPAYTRTCIHAK